MTTIKHAAANATEEISDPQISGLAMSRRTFIIGMASSGAISTSGCAIPFKDSVQPEEQTNLTINGKPYQLSIEARSSLLDVLREKVGLNGAKKGCDHGQCGACTVHVNGKRVVSCLTLAVKLQGKNVTTIEGLETSSGHLHPMQAAFIKHDALQCGYCTPGQIMSAIACVQEGHATSDDQIKEYMSGNICRCGAYVGILAAIKDAASEMAGGDHA